MLTQQDLKEIGDIVDSKLEERLKYLPTKDEFAKRMDEVMGELQTIREEQTLISGSLSDHSDQLEDHDVRFGKIDKHLGISTTSS